MSTTTATAAITPVTDAATVITPLPGTTPAPVYPRNEDGSVNWRATLKPEHLYVKRESEDAVAKLLSLPVADIRNLAPEQIAQVPDRYLVIRKAGILELARLRGYSSALPEVKHVQRDYVVVQTWVEWLPFEGMPAKRTGAVGEANPENTSALGSKYLAAMATNRAFALAVRNFLQIDIVSSDELGAGNTAPEQEPSHIPTTSTPIAVGPVASLERAAKEGGFSFDQVKTAALARWKDDTAKLAANPATKRQIENDPTDWAQWSDVPARDCSTLISLIKTAVAARAQNRAAKEAVAAHTNGTAPVGATTPAHKTTPSKVTVRKTTSAARVAV